MSTLAERGTDELFRAIAGLVMLAAILAFHLVLGLLSGPIGEPFDRIVLWMFLGSMAFICTRIVWLAVTGRALKAPTKEVVGDTSDQV